MMWPSVCKDGEFHFEFNDAPWLDPMIYLSKRDNWDDTSRWPRRTGERVGKTCSTLPLADKRMEIPPRPKPSFIQAFCDVYRIPDAIEKFIPEIYLPSNDPCRYRYAQADSTAGLVLYDEGTSAFSHHSKDPAAGLRLNAFDLVRIHRFGSLDGMKQDGTPTSKLPSIAEMKRLTLRDPLVLEKMNNTETKPLTSIKDTSPSTTICRPPGESAGVDEGRVTYRTVEFVRSVLDTNEDGRPLKTIANFVIILENDPDLIGAIGYNSFSERPEILRPLPWNQATGSAWGDADRAALRYLTETRYGLNAYNLLDDAFTVVCQRNSFHPVLTLLDSHVWDGVPRLETLLVDCMGAPDTPYVRAVTKKWFAAGCARVRNPGCKFDFVLTLVGPQGSGKSEFTALIGYRSLGFHSDTAPSFDDAKVAAEATAGKWIVELGEMGSLKKHEVEHMKSFISSQESTFRAAYGRFPRTLKRQCIFIGTGNRDDYLTDATGNRRFWPVNVDPKHAFMPFRAYLTRETVDQIWAEADEAYKSGET